MSMENRFRNCLLLAIAAAARARDWNGRNEDNASINPRAGRKIATQNFECTLNPERLDSYIPSNEMKVPVIDD